MTQTQEPNPISSILLDTEEEERSVSDGRASKGEIGDLSLVV
jgi:hypothetical protein